MLPRRLKRSQARRFGEAGPAAAGEEGEEALQAVPDGSTHTRPSAADTLATARTVMVAPLSADGPPPDKRRHMATSSSTASLRGIDAFTGHRGSEFRKLSVGLMLSILSHLGPRDLLRLSQTCRLMHLLARDNELWRRLLWRARFNFLMPNLAPQLADVKVAEKMLRGEWVRRYRSLYLADHAAAQQLLDPYCRFTGVRGRLMVTAQGEPLNAFIMRKNRDGSQLIYTILQGVRQDSGNLYAIWMHSGHVSQRVILSPGNQWSLTQCANAEDVALEYPKMFYAITGVSWERRAELMRRPDDGTSLSCFLINLTGSPVDPTETVLLTPTMQRCGSATIVSLCAPTVSAAHADLDRQQIEDLRATVATLYGYCDWSISNHFQETLRREGIRYDSRRKPVRALTDNDLNNCQRLLQEVEQTLQSQGSESPAVTRQVLRSLSTEFCRLLPHWSVAGASADIADGTTCAVADGAAVTTFADRCVIDSQAAVEKKRVLLRAVSEARASLGHSAARNRVHIVWDESTEMIVRSQIHALVPQPPQP